MRTLPHDLSHPYTSHPRMYTLTLTLIHLAPSHVCTLTLTLTCAMLTCILSHSYTSHPRMCALTLKYTRAHAHMYSLTLIHLAPSHSHTFRQSLNHPSSKQIFVELDANFCVVCVSLPVPAFLQGCLSDHPPTPSKWVQTSALASAWSLDYHRPNSLPSLRVVFSTAAFP